MNMDMNNKNETQQRRVRSLINNNRVQAAMAELKQMLQQPDYGFLMSELSRIEESYNYMTEYLLRGFPDEHREAFFENTRDALYVLVDRIERVALMKSSEYLYFSQARVLENSEEPLSQLIISYEDYGRQIQLVKLSEADVSPLKREQESLLRRIFNYIWVTMPLSDGDLKFITETVVKDDSDYAASSQIITALFMGCLQFYERGRLLTLLDIYDNCKDINIRARALMAFTLSLYASRNRVSHDKALRVRLESWMDTDDNVSRLRGVIMDIVRTLDTERVNKTIREDVIGDMKKNIRPLIDKIIVKNQDGDEEINPDWQDMLQNSELGDKLKQLDEMQSEGADMMMYAFSSLKNFGFFQDIANWFLPFDSEHTQLSGCFDNLPMSFVTMLNTPSMLCDSDKYSFALSMMRVSEAQRKMMFDNMGGNDEMMSQMFSEAQLKMSASKEAFSNASLRYIRDINRFLKLFRVKEQFRDILRHPFVLSEIPFVGNQVSEDTDFAELVGEFYFKRKYYKDALLMFLMLEKQGDVQASLYEKIGYLQERLGHLNEAMVYYRKAELFNPDSVWLIKQLAGINSQLANYADAEEYYRRALEFNPENRAQILGLANVLVEQKKYEEALQLFHKVNYLSPGHLNSMRGIAWVEFLNGNYQKSLEYHQKVLLTSEYTMTDCINAGHAALLSGNADKALKLYRDSLLAKGGSIEKLLEVAQEDRQMMLQLGVQAVDYDILVDKASV